MIKINDCEESFDDTLLQNNDHSEKTVDLGKSQAHSKWPHLYMAYVLGVCNNLSSPNHFEMELDIFY